MKNLYLLPTDKPSRLYFNHIKVFEKYQFSKEPFINGFTYTSNYHVYITNDEKIKEGDWYFDGIDLIHKKTKYNDALVDGNKNAKKIILTTDEDLIKDGVQAIDDEFLEWFCSKNGEVDFVEVIPIEDEKN